METKTELRQRIIAQRNALSSTERNALSSQISQRLIDTNLLSKYQHVAGYVAIKAEVSMQAIFDYLWYSGISSYLPRVASSRAMQFVHYTSETPMCRNAQYSFLEPAADLQATDLACLEFIVMPVVAFDFSGNRLGWGSGFYDCTLASYVDNVSSIRPICIGLAYECQKVGKLATDPWDWPMDAVVTEQAFYVCSDRIKQ